MEFTVEAVYEDGVLKPVQLLSFQEHEKVRLTVQPVLSRARQTAGLLRWKGDPRAPGALHHGSGTRSLGGIMTFSVLPAGATVFFDANILLYHEFKSWRSLLTFSTRLPRSHNKPACCTTTP
jgi:predicted DNA-binding antitoxin AbrB/MazE fold protein